MHCSINLVIFSGTEDGFVQAWNLLDGKTFGEPIREEAAIVRIGLDNDGKRLLVTKGNATARTIDVLDVLIEKYEDERVPALSRTLGVSESCCSQEMSNGN
jgi:hypothetical protein